MRNFACNRCDLRIRNPWSGVVRLWPTHSHRVLRRPLLSPFWISISMANAAAVEAPPLQEGGSGDPSPDSSAASGDHQAEAEAAGAEAAEPVIESDFILDTGAAVHATGDERLISDARDLGPGDAAASMTRRDGTKLQATAVGVVRRGAISLPDVHCFPDLPPATTLVSVQQLSRRGFSVEFRGSACVVRDGSTGAVVGEGQLRDDDGFYHLDFLMIPIT